MPDGFSFHLSGFKEAEAELAAIERRMEAATMWALRELGHTVSTESARRAPVYQGSRPDIESGALRRAIRPSRVRHEGPLMGLSVGPRGERVHLYAGKIEERTPYMREGQVAGATLLAEAFAKAWGAAMKGR